MSLSTRLTRAGLALLVFGALSAVLPSTAVSYAATTKCSDNNAGPAIAAGVLGGGIIYGATSGLFAAGNDKKKKNQATDTFVYHGDQGLN
ncbi:MAG TPA: hypothetical protein VGK19_06165 [Capsulimonadaceae bacterium]